MTLDIQNCTVQVSKSLVLCEQKLSSIEGTFNSNFSEIESGVSGTVAKIRDCFSRIQLDFDSQASDLPFSFSDDIEGSCEELEVAFDDIKSHAESVADTIELLVNETQAFVDRVNDLETDFLDQVDFIKEQFESRSDKVKALVVDKCEELVEFTDETCEEFTNSFEQIIEKEINDGFESTHEDAIGRLENCDKQCSQFVDDIFEALNSKVDSVFTRIADNSKDKLQSRLKKTGDEVKDMLVQDVQEEALRMVITSQVGTQITLMLQPYLPQLMMANMMAPSVQSALQVMRMGF